MTAVSADLFKSLLLQISAAVKHWRFGSKQQLAFLEDFYALINDGIPANRAVDMMIDVTQGLSKEVAMTLSERLGEGASLADGMQGWFAPNITEIIRVGESGGALVQTVQSSIKALSQHNLAMGAFIGALAYPIMVIAMACGIAVYLNTSIFKQFRDIKPESEWPDAGRRLVNFANFVQHGWFGVVIAIFLLVLLLRYIFKNYTGHLRPILDRYPPFSFYRKLVAAQFLETLGLLVENGIVFKAALRVMQYQAPPYLGAHLMQMERLLGTGKTNIADVLNTGLIPHGDLMRLRVMAEVKGFEHGLQRMGIRGAEEATATLKTIAKILGGLLLGVGAILVVIVMQGVYLTGMSMGSV